jgi:hypothetical protein
VSRHAVAALEFGLLAPVMVVMLIGVFNLAKIAVLWEQVWSASRSIAESATTLAIVTNSATATPTPCGPPPGSSPPGSSWLCYSQADEALSAVYAEIPWVAAGIASGNYKGTGQLPPNTVTAVLSSVNLVPTASGTFTTQVIWSKAYVPPNGLTGFDFSSGVLRSCGEPLPKGTVPDGVASAYKAAGITVPDPFLMADVKLVYTPYLFDIITGKVTLRATSYVPVRTNVPNAAPTAEYAVLDDANDPNASAVCNDTNPS